MLSNKVYVYCTGQKLWTEQTVAFEGFLRAKDYKISAFILGEFFGHGVFTTALVQNGRIKYQWAHQKRLKNDMQLVEQNLDNFESIFEDITTLVKKHASSSFDICRILVTPSQIITVVSPIDMQAFSIKKHVKLGLFEDPRKGILVKTSLRKNLDELQLQAKSQGFDTALLYYKDNKGRKVISEGCISHLLKFDGECFYYSSTAIMGSTLEAFKVFCAENSFECVSTVFYNDQLTDDAILYTLSALQGLLAVEQLGSRQYSPKKLPLIFDNFCGIESV